MIAGRSPPNALGARNFGLDGGVTNGRGRKDSWYHRSTGAWRLLATRPITSARCGPSGDATARRYAENSTECGPPTIDADGPIYPESPHSKGVRGLTGRPTAVPLRRTPSGDGSHRVWKGPWALLNAGVRRAF